MFRYFSLSKKSSFIFIDTENPALPQVDAKRRRIPELPRGVGFHILSELANKYDGGVFRGRAGRYVLCKTDAQGDEVRCCGSQYVTMKNCIGIIRKS